MKKYEKVGPFWPWTESWSLKRFISQNTQKKEIVDNHKLDFWIWIWKLYWSVIGKKWVFQNSLNKTNSTSFSHRKSIFVLLVIFSFLLRRPKKLGIGSGLDGKSVFKLVGWSRNFLWAFYVLDNYTDFFFIELVRELFTAITMFLPRIP